MDAIAVSAFSDELVMILGVTTSIHQRAFLSSFVKNRVEGLIVRARWNSLRRIATGVAVVSWLPKLHKPIGRESQKYVSGKHTNMRAVRF